MSHLHSFIGLLVLAGLAWLIGERRRVGALRIALGGIGLQLAVAALLLGLEPVQALFTALNRVVLALEESIRAGTSLVFGYLGGSDLPFVVDGVGNPYVLAFRGLPLVLLVSALSALLFYWRVLPLLVRGMAWVLKRTLGVGGALGVVVSANVFVGMTEAPLLIRPYLQQLSRSEMFALMVSGMATIAGTMMVLYASILGPVLPDALGHILTASLISAPAAVTVARLMIPETDSSAGGDYQPERGADSAMDALVKGTLAGLKLLLNIIAMLLVFVAVIHLVDLILGLLPSVGDAPLSLERIFGWLMAPLMWLIGIPWAEAQAAGAVMGVKTVLNEFVAYLSLASGDHGLSERSRLILIYALCGFANPGSVGIMIGGLATMVPERRAEIVALGGRSLVAGTLATLMTGAVVGVFTAG